MLSAKKIISVFDSEAKLDFPITNKDLQADQNKVHEDSRERTIEFLNGNQQKVEDERINAGNCDDDDDDDDRESLDSDDLEFEQFEFETPNLSKYSPRFLMEASGILVERNLPQSMSKTEKTKRKLAALETIPYLAKVNQVSSKELVEEILKGIVYFEIVNDNDAALVGDALESLAVVAPEFYAPAIVGEFYAESMPLEKRQIILASLSKAVKQLADNPFEELEEEIAFEKLALSAKVESQSRRWGSRPKARRCSSLDVLSRMIAFVGQIISLLDNIPEIEKYVLPSIDFLATFRRIDDTNLKLVIIKSYQVCLLSIASTKQEIWMDITWKMWLEECQSLDCPRLSLAATDLLNLF
ncbi:Oidioi.mRNA.OKI2018_I69.chr2.g8067.t1.cds [Oikopleura dioica]|uniref:Oidioi.mRNA.OKI2018_I69.chr2.g8067.t1.cds n=1 Tax=Oikopleura dioica TaxID=34765 RepID=A0ABN7TCM6_OIKDI|nr:Oidioi.mRNA.OKI2018_I69.chr2.g8067.t1.cds [Oikopleura dioica]